MSGERIHSENGSGQNEQFGWMNDAFRKWDAGKPVDRWEELDESLSLHAIWNKVEQSLEMEDRTTDDWMRSSHVDWNAGVPTLDWSALETSLDAADASRDEWMREQHANWDAGVPAGGWKKLDEALSLEKVWTDLDHSLDKKRPFRMSWIAAVASLIALLFAGSLNDMPFTPAATTPAIAAIDAEPAPAAREVMSDSPTSGAGTSDDLSTAPVDNVAPEQSRSFKPTYARANGSNLQSATLNHELASPVDTSEQPGHGKTLVQDAAPPSGDRRIELTVQPESLSFRQLTLGEKSLQALRFPDFKVPYHHWTLRVGMQVAFLPEKNRSELTSALPGFGMTSDLSFRHRLQSVQLIYAFGICKYAQQTGKYINGRYSTQHQQLNAMQLSAAIGWDYRRWMVFGGPFATKVLSGIEQKSNIITNVYNFNSLQFGVIAGIDYKLFASQSTGKHVSVGAQYQFIPRPLGQNASFDNIQSVRLQAKFSF